MKTSSTALVIFSLLVVSASLEAGYTIGPTLLSSREQTLVTARTTGSTRFYTGSTPPPYRVYLTQQGQVLRLIQPASVSQTRLTFLVPPLDSGYYGFMIRAQNPATLVWTTIYESSWRYFWIAPVNTSIKAVFSLADPAYPEVQHYAWEFLQVTQFVASGVITGSATLAPLISDGDSVLNWSILKDFSYDGEGDAGIVFSFDFNLDGYVTFHYAIPFEMEIALPRAVYTHQWVQFTPTSFRYLGVDSLAVGHSHDHSTTHELFVNVPYDTLPPFDVTLSQQPTQLFVSGSCPVECRG